jgi:hypothetical protein
MLFQVVELFLIQPDSGRSIQAFGNLPVFENEYRRYNVYRVFVAETRLVVGHDAQARPRFVLAEFVKNGQKPLRKRAPRSVEEDYDPVFRFQLVFKFVFDVNSAHCGLLPSCYSG